MRSVLVSAALLAASAGRASRGAGLPPPSARPPHREFQVGGLGDYGNIGVWPLPSNAQPAAGSLALDAANFTIVFDASDAFLSTVTERFRAALFFSPTAAPPSAGAATLRTLTLAVADASVRQIQQDTDESYSLTFSPDGASATLAGATIFGVRHGLETFVQLSGCARTPGAVYSVQAMNVSDAPRFPFRGLLVDSARHWLPPAVLLQMMDALAMNKMNTLQVGFAIDWSWTVQSAAFPNLTQKVSYGPPGTHMYARETVAWLVSEANYRGVRLIPYIEAVGHDALGEAVPQIMWCNGKNGSGLPHPLHAETWAFFDVLWADMKALFPEEYINVGGDEVDITCWENDPEINAWMTANGYPAGDWNWIVAHYYTQMIASLAKAGFKPIMFAEAFGALNATGVDLTNTGIIFDGWDEGTPGSLAAAIMAPGVKAIVSSYCFLAPTQSCPDNLPGGDTPNWFTNIACEIQNATLFPAAAVPFLGNIVGGHPSRWGEQTDGTNIIQFAWPAVLGAAEKLWSPYNLTDGRYYGSRQEVFADHRCLQIRRGVPIQPTSAYSWACDYEWEPAYPPLTPANANPYPFSSWAAPNTSAAAPAPALALADELRAARARIAELERELARATA